MSSTVQVSVTQTGQDSMSFDVEKGSTIKEVLRVEGYEDITDVTYNGVRTSDLDQEVSNGSSIFITRSHKAGLL